MKYDLRLVYRFRDYWELVLDRHRNQPDIPMLFHALGSDHDSIRMRFDEHGSPLNSLARGWHPLPVEQLG